MRKGRVGESVLGGLAIFLELFGEGLGSSEKPGGEQRAAHGMLSRGFQAGARSPTPSPGARAGLKDTPVSPHEHPLLDGRELNHAPAVLGVAEGREDLSGDTKIGWSMWVRSDVSGKESASRRKSLEVISRSGLLRVP